MKGIFKFFPVALAAVALASCSNDDLTAGTDDVQMVKDPNYLYVSLANGENITRSGYMTFVDPAREEGANKGRSILFYSGDSIKLYDNMGDWRPQIWVFDDEATRRYVKSQGVGVFNNLQRMIDGGTTTRYTSGYGIFPAGIAKFVNEERTAIEITLDTLKSFDYSRAKTAADHQFNTSYTNYYNNKGIMPYWGVAGDGEMKLNYLTGIGRADISDIKAASTGKANYLIVKSTKQLHATYAKVAFDPVAAVDESKDVRQANQPKLVTADAAANTAVDNTNNALVVKRAWNATGTGDVAEDIIAIKLDASAANDGVGKYTEVFFPIVPGTQDISVTLVRDVTETTTAGVTTINLSAAGEIKVIGTKDDEDIEAGKFYSFINPGALTLDGINTPQALANAIKAADESFDRDFTLTVTSAVAVKVGTDPNGYIMDFGTYALKHNVKVVFDQTGSNMGGFNKQASEPATLGNYLTINTPASDKVLTIEYKTSDVGGAAPLDSIVVNNKATSGYTADTELNSPLVLTTPTPATDRLPVVVNHSDNEKLTVNAATDLIKTTGKMTIDAKGCTVENVVLAGTTINEFKLNNGTITYLTTAGTVQTTGFTDNAQGYGKVAQDITIKSKGTSAIANVQLGNIKTVAANKPGSGIYFDSEWNHDSAPEATTKTGKIYTNATESTRDYVFTVAQLAAINDSKAVVAGTMDLEDADWTPLTTNADFAGADVNKNVYTTAANNPKAETKYPTIKNINKPLFNTITAANGAKYENIKLYNVKFAPTTNNQGAFARQLNITGTVTIDNVDVEDVEIATTGVLNSYGGLIGKVEGSSTPILNLLNIDVKNVEITANKYIGGIIGQLNNTNQPAVFIGADNSTTASLTAGANYGTYKPCTTENLTFKIVETPNVESDPEYKSQGAYIGYFFNNTANSLQIIGETLSYNFTNDAIYTNKGKWGTTLPSGAYITFDVVMGQKLIGYSGNSIERKAIFWTKSSNKLLKTIKQSYNKLAGGQTAASAGTLLYYVADNR